MSREDHRDPSHSLHGARRSIPCSALIFLLWIFLRFNWNFQRVQACDCVLPTCYATNHFENARLATERTPWWRHPRHAETCRRLTNVWRICILVHVDVKHQSYQNMNVIWKQHKNEEFSAEKKRYSTLVQKQEVLWNLYVGPNWW
jgi:hypothetical protein